MKAMSAKEEEARKMTDQFVNYFKKPDATEGTP
jgi:hypothetical protein